jgi:hypothetical protein
MGIVLWEALASNRMMAIKPTTGVGVGGKFLYWMLSWSVAYLEMKT